MKVVNTVNITCKTSLHVCCNGQVILAPRIKFVVFILLQSMMSTGDGDLSENSHLHGNSHPLIKKNIILKLK